MRNLNRSRGIDCLSSIRRFAPALLWAQAFCFPDAPRAETLKQDFNSLADLDAFWDKSSWTGSDRTHSPANVSIDNGILVLKLSGSQPGQLPVCAEITSKRSNFRYGSYRASIKTSRTAGGVVGWFVYRDSPLKEIDVEFLTQDITDIHFTLHNVQTDVDYQMKKLNFDPSLAFHEYRFDWHPDSVAYFVDGQPYATLKKKVPDMDTQIMLNHWSGNIAGWGGPAPTQDMFMYVDYMAYSSDFPAATNLAVPTPGRGEDPQRIGSESRMIFSDGQGTTSGVGVTVRLREGVPVYTLLGRNIRMVNLRNLTPLARDGKKLPGAQARSAGTGN